uniref:transmembrane protein 132E-like n=1 Tax=Myxine glutinosa TaxID=7769 RepID=UPI00358ED035
MDDHPAGLPSSEVQTQHMVLPAHLSLPRGHLSFALWPRHNSTNLQLQVPFALLGQKGVSKAGPPLVRVSLASLSAEQPVPARATGDLPDGLPGRVHGVVLSHEAWPEKPYVEVLFHVIGRDWDDHITLRRLPCVRLHASSGLLYHITSTCSLTQAPGLCLARLNLPGMWFQPRSDKPHLFTLTYELRSADIPGDCNSRTHGFGSRKVLGSLTLLSQPQSSMVEQRTKLGLVFSFPERVFMTGDEVLISVKKLPGVMLGGFILRVKAKRGLELLGLVQRHPDWLVATVIRHGGKESVATATVSQNQMRSTVRSNTNAVVPQEVLHVSLKVGNVTGEAVTRRLIWHIEPTSQEGHRPDPERLVVQLAVTSSSLRAIIPVPMDDELVNTAVLTGRTVSVPLRVVTVSTNGLMEGKSLQDVTARASCQAFQPDVIQVSKSCDYLYVSGREERGGVARIGFSFGSLTSDLSIKVWWPDLPLKVDLLPSHLSPIEAWLAPSSSHARSKQGDSIHDGRPGETDAECKVVSQNAQVRIVTKFILKDVITQDQWTPMFGHDWLVDVSDLVVREVKARDPDVAQVHDGNLVVGLSPGNTSIEVLSPLSGKVLGAAPITVLSIPVLPVRLRLLPIGKISLGIDPTSGGNATFVATVTADSLLDATRQVT